MDLRQNPSGHHGRAAGSSTRSMPAGLALTARFAAVASPVVSVTAMAVLFGTVEHA
jgi:hypothetical protein